MKTRMLLLISVLMLTVLASAQHLETTIKVVDGKARVAIRATGGDVIGYPSNSIIVVAIPVANANAGVTLNIPTKLDPSRISENPVTALPVFTDATYKYFLLFYTGTSFSRTAPIVFRNGEEYDIIELTWDGPAQSFPVSLVSLPGGNPLNPVAPSQWQHYLEVGGAEVSTPRNYFYQSATSNPPINAVDYSTGIAIVTTKTSISTTLSNNPVTNPYTFRFGGLFPNPASTQVNVIIDAPKRDKIMVVVTDMGGKTVIQQQANVDIGSNTVPVDVAKLAGGSYMVKLTCQSSDCQTAAAKFNKQ